MEEKTIFITGASRGIGKAIAERFTAAGCRIVAPSRTDLDLADRGSVMRYLQRAPLEADVLINNAGENRINSIGKLAVEDWERGMAINLTAPMLLTQGASPHMRARKWGRIVNISSMYSLISRAGRSAYTTSKAGLNGFTRTAAIELAPDNILVNAVCPGFVETEMTRRNNTPADIDALCRQLPIGRLAQPAEIANLVYFLASDENTFVTGQTIVADGGFTIV